MARLPRLGLAGWPHLLCQQAHDQQALARDDTDRQALLDAVREAARTHRVSVHAYHLGGSALILLVTPQTAEGPSGLMQAVGRRYVAAFNRRHARSGGLWAGRYRCTVLDPARNLLDAMVFTETQEDLRHEWGGASWSVWSSAGHHLGTRTDPLITDHPLFWSLGNTPFERQAAWRRRLTEGLGDERTREIEGAMRKGWALAPPEQLQLLEAQGGRRLAPRPRGRPPRKHS
jgi:putative transposase